MLRDQELGKSGFLFGVEVGQTFVARDRRHGTETLALVSIGVDRVGLINLSTGRKFDADKDRLTRQGKIGSARIDKIVPPQPRRM